MCVWNPLKCALRDRHSGPCLTAKELDKIIEKQTKELDKELKNGFEEAS
jgi:hypothetical protein